MSSSSTRLAGRMVGVGTLLLTLAFGGDALAPFEPESAKAPGSFQPQATALRDVTLQTAPGTCGQWRIRLELSGASGAVSFRVQEPKSRPAHRRGRRPAAGDAGPDHVPGAHGDRERPGRGDAARAKVAAARARAY